MTSAFEIFAGKDVDVKIALAAKRTFHFFVPVDDKRRHADPLDGERVVDEAFGIAGLDLIPDEVFPGDGDERRVMLIKDLHAVLQHKAGKSKPVLEEVIK